MTDIEYETTINESLERTLSQLGWPVRSVVVECRACDNTWTLYGHDYSVEAMLATDVAELCRTHAERTEPDDGIGHTGFDIRVSPRVMIDESITVGNVE